MFPRNSKFDGDWFWTGKKPKKMNFDAHPSENDKMADTMMTKKTTRFGTKIKERFLGNDEETD